MEENEKINLVSSIWDNAKELKGDYKSDEIFKYFLTKNIQMIYGKEDFSKSEIALIGNNIYIIGAHEHQPVLEELNADDRYKFFTTKQIGIEQVLENEHTAFKIIKEDSKIKNSVTYIKKGYSITEYQTVHLEEIPYFDYQIQVASLDGEETISLSPGLRAKPLSIRKGMENVLYVQEIKGEESKMDKRSEERISMELIKKVIKTYYNNLKEPSEIISVPFSHSTLGINASLEDIFSALEKKVEPIELKEDNKKGTKRNRVRKSVFK